MVQQATTFFHSKELNEEQGGKDFVVNFQFTAAAPVIANANSLDEIGLMSLQTVYIDNSGSPGPTSLMITGTRQVITAPPFTQGFYRVLGSPRTLDYTVTNFSGGSLPGGAATPVSVHFINLSLDCDLVWSVWSPVSQQGTPFAASSAGANAILNATMPAIVGRRSYVTGLQLSGDGSTAGLGVNATLTNIESVGVAVTLNYAFGFPQGALVPASALAIAFSPPLPVLLGAAAVLSLPAGGAGNTNAAIALEGFYI